MGRLTTSFQMAEHVSAVDISVEPVAARPELR
jgi:hypothetical protein